MTRISRICLAAAGALLVGGLARADEADPAEGKMTFVTCMACHGAQAEGKEAFNTPRLAGQDAWYLKRQLVKFRKGVRGYHSQDIGGMQMAPMAKILPNEQAIDNVIAHIGTLKPEKPADKSPGDTAKGQVLFAVCVTCHGDKGQGNSTQKGPRLVGQHSWYLVRQINNFRAGIRGKHESDDEGKLMHPIALTLVDEHSINDVVAYIQTLPQ